MCCWIFLWLTWEISFKIWPIHSHGCRWYRLWRYWWYYWPLWWLKLLLIILSMGLWWCPSLIHYCLPCLLILPLVHLCIGLLFLICCWILSNLFINCQISFFYMVNTTSFSVSVDCWYSSSVCTINVYVKKQSSQHARHINFLLLKRSQMNTHVAWHTSLYSLL